MTERHMLVTGASGLTGRAAVEHFAAAGWKVTAVSRRPPLENYGAGFVSLDLSDAGACRDALGGAGITHVVFAALHEEPRLVEGWVSQRHIDRNLAMLRNTVEAIDGPRSALEHVILVHGPKAYGVHADAADLPAREDRSERRDIPNFYWAQQDYIRDRQIGRPWAWTLFRPMMVIGEAVGSAMNLVVALGVYAAFLKERGEPLHYPGSTNLIAQASDTALMAEAFDWAIRTPQAANEIYNLTNGEISAMRTLWPAIAASVGMEPGEVTPISFERELSGRDADWELIKERHDLLGPDMSTLVGQSFQLADFCFSLGEGAHIPPGIMSTIKIRRAGFSSYLGTEEMFAKWFGRYQQRRLLPPP